MRLAKRSRPHAEDSAIIGNGALHGATGGTLLVCGRAGDRSAVRNSGATAVVEGVGLHACAYMTAGTVAIVGEASHKFGSSMTGGTLYLLRTQVGMLNTDYLTFSDLRDVHVRELRALLNAHLRSTDSDCARRLLCGNNIGRQFVRCTSREGDWL